MKIQLKKRPQSALGLHLGGGRLRAALVEHSKSGWEVTRSASAALSLDLLHPEPELVGREIRNHLDAAGIREKLCAVAIPDDWVMCVQTKLPELAAEDMDSYLQIEAEKGFPCDTNQLEIARSRQTLAAAAYVTQFGVRKEQLDRLAAVIKAAGLKPVSFSPGLTSLPGVIQPAGSGRVTVAVEPGGAALAVSVGGGLAAHRTFEAAIESEAGEKVVNGGSVAREIRISLEQVPDELRGDLRTLALCGDGALVRQLAERVGDWAAASGLKVEMAGGADGSLAESMARAVAGQWLEPRGPYLEFLPRRPGRVAVFVRRYRSKRLGTAGLAAAAVLAVILVAFGWQEVRLVLLRNQWGQIADQVTTFKGVQDKIRLFHPWYDTSFADLRIFNRVTECFPQNGSLTAKTLEIHKVGGVTTVKIDGTVRNERALLQTQDALRQAKDVVQDVNVDSISGKMPAQFSLSFRWTGSPGI